VTVCLIDTTVFCCIVPVPGRDQERPGVSEQMQSLIRDQVSLILPLAAIIETGNHIAQRGDGTVRRDAAARFVTIVADAIEGRTPFTPTPFFKPTEVGGWLSEFPERAMRGIGLADLSMIKEFHRQCALTPHRRVFIWSLDHHLSSYDQPAPEV